MSKVIARIELELAPGELKEIAGDLWTRAESAILQAIRRHDAAGMTLRELAHATSHQTTSKERAEALAGLKRDKIIEVVPRGSKIKIRKGKT